MILIINTHLLSMDPVVGDVPHADVRISEHTGEILAIARSSGLQGLPYDTVISGDGTITIPGFVDTHRHLWETALRNVAPNHTLKDYFRDILGRYAPRYWPEDVHLSNLVGALGALNAGVTQILDWSHIQNTPAHTDAALQGLRQAGIRFTFAYGTPMDGSEWWGPSVRRAHPTDVLRRLTAYGVGTPLGSVALAARGPDWSTAETAVEDFRVARANGARISVHINGFDAIHALVRADSSILGPDITFIHGCHLTDEEMVQIAGSGGHLSIAPQVEMLMGHGHPPFIKAMRHTINTSLSVDVETTVPGDMFTQMRTAHLVAKRSAHQQGLPGPTARDILQMATINGAKALGTDKITGSITPGKAADLVVLRADTLNVAPVNDPYGAVLAMDTSNVSAVLVNGVVVKNHGGMIGAASHRGLLKSLKERANRIIGGDK